ncbi:MAG: hypothetical protein JNM94_13780 [Phycisphaerae bacterium]|nr:hypothetical protein [Phycisphaerae bacterium]
MPRPFVLVSILALAAAGPLVADDKTPTAPPAATAGIPSDLDARLVDVLGRPLAARPPLVETDTATIMAAVGKDLVAQALASGLDLAAANAAAEAARPMIAASVSKQLAYYSHAERTIFVNTALLESLVASGAIPASLRARVIALAVTRELARATQDQEFPLREFLRLPSGADPSFTAEAATARRAVSEGHASATAEFVGVALGASDPAWLSALQAFERSMPGSLTAPKTPSDVVDMIVYRGGKRRLEGAYRAGGAAAAWALFSSPPTTNAGFDLALIAYDGDLSTSMAAALQPAVGKLGKEWAGQTMKNTPAAAFGAQLNRMEAATRNAYLSSVEGIASAAATSSAGTRIMLSVTKAIDAPGADLVWEELGKMNAYAISTMPADPPSSEEKTENGIRSAAARLMMKNGPSQIPATVCRMRDGEWILQLSYLNGEPTFDRVREIGTLMLEAAKQWEKAATAAPTAPPPAPPAPPAPKTPTR